MAFSYRQVKDLYDTLKGAGATQLSLPEWSAQRMEDSGSDLYAAGLNDNWIKQGSVAIDRLIEATPLDELGRSFGRSAGNLVGMGDFGEEIGSTIPRMTADLAPMMIGGLLGGPVGAMAGKVATGVLSGANAYTATGSPASGLIAGGLNMALPGITNKAEQGVLSFLRNRGIAKGIDEALLPRLSQGPLAKGFNAAGEAVDVSQARQLFSRSIPQSLAAEAGGQLAAAGVLTGSTVAQQAFSEEGIQNPFTKEFALEQILTQIPFTALHLGTKAAGMTKSPMARADQMDAAIQKTEQAISLKSARDTLAQRTPVEQPPAPLEVDPEVIAETNALLSKLGIQREALKVDPTPESAEKLSQIHEQEAEAVKKAIAETGGVGLGRTDGIDSDEGKIRVLGKDHFYKENKGTGKTGYHVITVAEGSELVGQTYPLTGEPIQVGDRIGFPAGLRDPLVNTDPNDPTFLLPRNKFTKVVDRPFEKRVAETGDPTPELPMQKLALDLQQHAENIRALNRLEVEATTFESQGELLDILTKFNTIRSLAGFPEIDLASFEASARKAKIKNEKAAMKAAIAETKALIVASDKGKAERMELMKKEIEIEAHIRNLANSGNEEAIKIVKIADQLAGESGRRNDILSSGLFWQKAMELDAEGNLSASRLANWKETVAATGKGLKKDITALEEEVPMPPILFKALTAEEQAFNRMVVEKVVELTAGDDSDEARIFKGVVASGDLAFRRDSVEEIIKELGIASDTEAPLMASEFIQDPKVIGWARGLRQMAHQNVLPERTANPAPGLPKQLPAGGPFVWNLDHLDTERMRLGQKHQLPRSGIVPIAQFKAIGGRGKPLQDVEIEMMQAIDQAVGGKAFDENGNVDVKKLVQVLKDNPVVIETHEYGQEGKVSEAKAELDKMTHEWFDTLTSEERNAVSEYHLSVLRKLNWSEEQLEKAREYDALKHKVTSELPDTSPRATSYYNQISPFDTKKFPVVRVDVVLPKDAGGLVEPPPGIDSLEDAKAYYHRGMISAKEYEQYKATGKWSRTLWSPDNLHENLPNTLGWAMVQFVPDPRTGEIVAFVGEQQSRWGQEVRKKEESVRRLSEGETEVTEGTPLARDVKAIKETNHPLLPLQHVLVLKAAIAEAQKRGVTKMVVSDGETAMMTEAHDKSVTQDTNDAGGLRVDEQGRPLMRRPSQEGGMRLHYDTTLPSAMSKLTGEKGERVEMGVHKNAMGNGVWQDNGPDQPRTHTGERQVVGSPVFRNPDGTPKSSVTGTSYDISKALGTMESQGGFTLGDPNRSPKIEIPFEPQTPRHVEITKRLHSDGHGLLKLIEGDDASPADKALASDLLRNFPEALKLISSKVVANPGAFAFREEDARVSMEFGPDMVTASPWYRNNAILHEVVHGLTLHQLEGMHSRPELVTKIDAIRDRLIKALNPKQKEWLDRAIKSNWLRRWANRGGEDLYDELTPEKEGGTAKDHQILYALLNNKELVAQGFSSPSVRDFMQSVKGPQGERTAFKAFAGWVRQLLNIGERVAQTEFENFMEVSHQLMRQGEFLATAQQFGEKYFAGKGMDEEYGRYQTTRALGLIAESGQGLTKSQIMASLGMGEDASNVRLTRAQAQFDEAMNDPDQAAHVTNLLAEEGARDVSEYVESTVAEGRDIGDALDIMPEAASKYVYEKLRDSRDVLEVIHAMTKKGSEGLVGIEKPEKVRAPIIKVLKSIEKVLAHERRQIETARDLAGMDSVEPMAFLNKVARIANPAAVPDPGLQPFLSKDEQSWIANFAEPLGQLARRIPESAELISKLFQQSSNARRSFSNRVKVLGTDNSSDFISPEPTHESVKKMSALFANPKLLRATNRWIYWNQKHGGKEVQMLSESHADVAKELAGLNADERAQVHEAVANQVRSTQMGHKDVLDYMTQEATVTGAGVIQTMMGGKLKDNVRLSDGLLKGLMKMKDPMTQWQGQAEITAIQQQMAGNPQAFLDALKFASGEADKITMQKEYFDKNPAWATAARTEQFLIKGRKGKQRMTLQASSMKEAKEIAQKQGLTEVEIRDNWKDKEDEPFAYPNMTPEMAKRMQEIELTQIEMLRQKGILKDEAEVAEFKRTSAVLQILREADAENALPGVPTPPRLLSQGAEELPWMWNHISHAQRESNYWSRRLLRAEARVHLRDPELASNEVIQKRLSTAVDNLLHPDPIAAQNMRKFMSTWFLGFNPATVLVNASQPFVNGVAELTAVTGKPLDSYRRILRALKLAGSHKFGGKSFGDPELDALIKKATQDGEVGIGKYDDEAAAQESIATNYKRAMMKNKPQSVGQRLGTASGAYSTAGMWLFQHGERLNNLAGLIAGYELYRSKGLSKEEATQKAYEFNRAVNFSGGRAQRSVGAFSGRGAFPRTAAMLGTSLQSYVLGTTAQIGRYLHSGLFRPSGLTPHEVFAARKAAIQMLGTQFAAAGLLGLPFASGALALLDKLFPDLELNRRTRETVNEFLSSDDENGSVLSDIAMTGIPSALGWDLQSRLSMGNTLPGVSEVNGFQVENLMGPAASLVKNFVGGVTGWASGDAAAGSKFLPPGIKKMVEAGRATLGGEGLRDYGGRPLEDVTPGENLGAWLGFQPKRLSDQNAASRILKASEENFNRRQGQERQAWAEEVLKGNFGTVGHELRARAREDRTFDGVLAVRGIAKAAEELHFPRDLRREGSSGTSSARKSFLASFAGITSQPSEVARLQLRKQVEARLGLPPNPSSLQSELSMAKLMDQLRIAQPNATRSELRQAAERALRRSAPRELEFLE